ncbi:MAG: hypothetical protein WCW26_04420 [Candidatus Buchananbacteria bacterium]
MKRMILMFLMATVVCPAAMAQVSIQFENVPRYWCDWDNCDNECMVSGWLVGSDNPAGYVIGILIEGDDYVIYPKFLGTRWTSIGATNYWSQNVVDNSADRKFRSAKAYLLPATVVPTLATYLSWQEADAAMKSAGSMADVSAVRAQGDPGVRGPKVPTLKFTFLPLLGDTVGHVVGTATEYAAGDKVCVTIYAAGGWYLKAIEVVDGQGNWSCDTVQGGDDKNATEIWACLYSGADPIDPAGSPFLPTVEDCKATVSVTRHAGIELTSVPAQGTPDGKVTGRLLWVDPDSYWAWPCAKVAGRWVYLPDYTPTYPAANGTFQVDVVCGLFGDSPLARYATDFGAALTVVGEWPQFNLNVGLYDQLPLADDKVTAWASVVPAPEEVPKLCSMSVPWFVDGPRKK